MAKGKEEQSKYNFLFYLIPLILLAFVVTLLIKPSQEKVVVVYVSQDQDYAEPLLKEFEKETGIKVQALYDTEATKSVGLVMRLIAEKDNPQADVFWNNEPLRTILLKEAGILQPYCSPNAKDIPDEFKDKDCYWSGFASRARVIIYDPNRISTEPNSIFDFIDPRWKGKACISNPFVGSGASWSAGIFAVLGYDKAREFFIKMKENDVKVLESPSMVRDQVLAGECLFGSTDTDDAYDAIKEGKSIKIVFPDRGGIGTFFFPNTVAMIKGAKHPEEAKKLIDFLLSSKVEEALEKEAMQIPLKKSSKKLDFIPSIDKIDKFNVSYEQIFRVYNVTQNFLQQLYLR